MKFFAKSVSISRFLTVAVIAAGPAQAEEHQSYSAFRIGMGADFSSGDYGTGQDTEIFSVPVTFKYVTDPWTLRLMVPYIEITGSGDVVGGTDTPVVIGSPSTRGSQSGLGDIVSGISYAILPTNDAMPLIEFTGKVKFPTADESKGLGTGGFD